MWLEADGSLHQTLFFLLFRILPPPLLQASFQTLVLLQSSEDKERGGGESQAVYTGGVSDACFRTDMLLRELITAVYTGSTTTHLPHLFATLLISSTRHMVLG